VTAGIIMTFVGTSFAMCAGVESAVNIVTQVSKKLMSLRKYLNIHFVMTFRTMDVGGQIVNFSIVHVRKRTTPDRLENCHLE
jgi:hypothetical protein